jgi:hypothetical protein
VLKNVLNLPVFVIFFFFYPVVQAAQVDGLYEAQVPVASQDAAERSKGLREAFRKVIMKASGQSSFYSDQADVLSRARDHVEQFGYRSREQDGKRQLLLWARFNPEGVRRAVRDAGLPVWPEERPSTLVWLAIEEGDDRMILAGDSEHVAQKTLNEIARERGLPIVLPLMDLTEQSTIQFQEVASLSPDRLQEQSQKYDSQYLLIGHIQSVQDGLWRGRWFIADDQQDVILTPPGTLADIIASGINPLANRIAREFASFAYVGSPQYLDIMVQDLNGANDYATTLKYLESLSLVTQVDVTRVEGRNAWFQVHTPADIAAFLQVIELGRVLYARDSTDQLVFGLTP